MAKNLSSANPSISREAHEDEPDANRPQEKFVLRNEQRVAIRPIEPSDASALADFHDRLSPMSIHNRFFGAHPHLTTEEARTFAMIDHHRRMAYVALVDWTIVGVGRYEGMDDHVEAEVAFVVADDLQGQGLGTIFLELLAQKARLNGYSKFTAQVLSGNSCMREVFANSRLPSHFENRMGVIDVVLELGSDQVGATPLAGSSNQLESGAILNDRERKASSASSTVTL